MLDYKGSPLFLINHDPVISIIRFNNIYAMAHLVEEILCKVRSPDLTKLTLKYFADFPLLLVKKIEHLTK